MYLSELYGRIGQVLRENGDAPIGELMTPYTGIVSVDELVREKHIDITLNKNQVPDKNCTVRCYELKVR